MFSGEFQCSSACRAMTLGTFLSFIEKKELWSPQEPFIGVALSELVTSVKGLDTAPWREADANFPHLCRHSDFGTIFQEMSDQVEGLDLKALNLKLVLLSEWLALLMMIPYRIDPYRLELRTSSSDFLDDWNTGKLRLTKNLGFLN